MWKLLEPRSTAARISGGRPEARASAAGLTAGALRRGRSSGGEGGTAAAGRRRVRIADDELRSVESLAIVDLGPHQVLHAHGVDEELHALIDDAGIPVLLG